MSLLIVIGFRSFLLPMDKWFSPAVGFVTVGDAHAAHFPQTVLNQLPANPCL